MEIFAVPFQQLDLCVAVLLFPLAVWCVVSGLDDLLVDTVAALASFRRTTPPSACDLRRRPQLRTAIFVPCWNESAVIGRMVENNVRSISYEAFDVFVGAYPNDRSTIDAVEALEARFVNVHLALCPHDGPTSKADCLNWIYQRMLEREIHTGIRYDVVVTHDAEDVIHPDSLLLMSWYVADHDMVQVPVLPLATPVGHWTHGVYCDEFAEYQARDMIARQFVGAFVPSSGVGTAFRRDALEELAASASNRVFEPVCLTEDYENGFRLGLRGARQTFLPLSVFGVTTREYFPKTFAAAVRQRTRWVTGIALQSWDRHGWRGKAVYKYWLWRDRKGLVGNPASLLMNLLSTYGLLSWMVARLSGSEWLLGSKIADLSALLTATACFGSYRLLYRAASTWRHFGWRMAATSPVRIVLANVINSAAAVRALLNFTTAKLNHQPLRWAKTEHEYPSLAALACNRPTLEEVLVRNGWMGAAELRFALATKPAGVRAGEHLVSQGCITEEELYDALSLQHSIARCTVDPHDVRTALARAIPAPVAREWKLLPFKVEAGCLFLGVPEPPTQAMESAVRSFTRLEPRFQLITPGNYERLIAALW